MSTVHIGAEKGDIAPRVLMPGDPNRAYYIAQKYLQNPRLVNKVRGELAYTGTYKGVSVTIFASGMGIPSMGIYSYELFHDFDVEKIIRIGTAGSYLEDLKIYDILLADSSYSESTFDKQSGKDEMDIINSSTELNGDITNTALLSNVPLKVGRVHTSDAFYNEETVEDYKKYTDMGCMAVEMETFALLYNAKKFMKKATALITISDNLVTHELIDSESREKKLDEMIVLALESIIKE